MEAKIYSVYVLFKLLENSSTMEKYDEAKDYGLKMLVIEKSLGRQFYIASALDDLGVISIMRGEFSQASEYLQEALDTWKRIGNQRGIGYVTSNLGSLALGQGDVQKAKNEFRAALQIGLDLEGEINMSLLAYVLSSAANLLRQIDERERAVEFATLGLDRPDNPIFLKSRTQKLLTHLQQEIPQNEFNAAQERGRERDVQATAEEMLALLEREDLVSNSGT
jgi:tetratricopeptide (TPR) repeat protein